MDEEVDRYDELDQAESTRVRIFAILECEQHC